MILGGNLFWGKCNSPLDLHSADLANFGEQQTQSLVVSPKFAKNHESQTENPSVVDSALGAESSKKNQCEAPENLPASWCKKSELKGAEVPPADFLLEAEKRGSPPKSEKAAAFWRVGGVGRGVQPFLRKEKNSNESAESSKKIKLKKLIKSFCYFLLLQKVESPLLLKHNLPSGVILQNLKMQNLASFSNVRQ